MSMIAIIASVSANAKRPFYYVPEHGSLIP